MAIHTRSTLPQGESVIQWGGEVFTQADVEAGLARQHTVVGISSTLYLGNPVDQPPSLDDYMNHSCDPNVGMKDAITLITIRDIAEGEELTADYAMWLNDENYVMKTKCNCGSADCRSIVTGLDYGMLSVQAKIFRFMSPFLRDRINRTKEKA